MKLVDRRTGKIVDVPDDQATGLFKSGMFGILPGAPLPVAQPGIIGTVDAKDASQAIRDGLTVPNEADFRAAQQQARYGGAGGAAAAAGVGAVRGAGMAFGLPTDDALVGAAKAFGSPEQVADPYRGQVTLSPGTQMREALGGLQAEHPYASTAGELAGMAGVGLLTGGETPLGALGSIGEELLPSAAGRVARGVARGTFEGGGMGAVSALNESALGDTDLNAEKVVAAMGHSAFMGAGLGAAFSGLGVAKDAARNKVGQWIGQLAPKDVDAIAAKQFGYVPEGLGQRVQKAYAKMAAGVAGKDVDVVDKLTSLTPEGAESRRVAVFDAPKIQDAAEREIRGFGDTMMREEPKVSELARGELKRDFVERSVKRGNEAEVNTAVSDRINQLLDGVVGQLEHPEGTAPQYTKALEGLSTMAYRAQAALDHGNGAAFFEVDQLKRAAQRYAANGTRGIAAMADPVERINARRSLDFIKSAAEDFRGLLEDEDLWGKPATAQREVNEAWTKQIEAKRRFDKALTTDVGRNPDDPYERLTGIDPGKLNSYVRSLTNPNQDLTHAAVRDYANSTRELVDAIKKHYELGPSELSAVDSVHKSAVGFGKQLAKAGDALALANQYRALTEGSTDSLSAILGTVGGVVGGLPGGAIGAAAGAVANPGRVVSQLASVERLLMKVDTRIGSNLRRFFSGAEMPAAPLPETATSKGFDDVVERLGRSVDMDGNITPAGRASIADAIGDLGEGAPKLAVAVGIKAMNVATFLAGKIPPAMRNPYEMFPGEEPPLVSETERETFARYVHAAEDPMTVVAHLARGDVTPEEADTLEHCYPKIYEEVRTQLDAAVRAGQAKGKPLDYDKRVSYGVLFKERTDATMDPEVLQAVASAQAQRGGRGKKGAGGGGMRAPTRLRSAPGIASRMQTTFGALGGGGSRKKGGLL